MVKKNRSKKKQVVIFELVDARFDKIVNINESQLSRAFTPGELVWVDDKPVNVTSNSLEYKTVKNDKLINYTLTFNYAYNEINNVY